MKTRLSSLLFVLLAGTLDGANQPAAVVPQPRPRLSPEVIATVAPARAEPPAADPATVTLDRYVVREHGGIPPGPRAEPEPQGNFSLRHGGRFFGGKPGQARVEAGLWPYFDIFVEDARFKPQKISVGLDFLRIRW